MHFKATIRAATSSYLGALSAAATGLLSIRLATQFLSKEEFGLWSFTMQTVGYFMLLDLGVSNSVSRLFGDPLASGDRQKINSWFSLSLITLAGQGLFIVVMGMLLRPFVLKWFEIPPHLIERASDLWMAFLMIQAVSLVFKISFAILHAQNRVYWTSNLQVLGSWVGLGAFYIMVTHGWGVLSYAWSSGVAALVISLGGVWAVKKGGTRFKLSLVGVTRSEVRKLFTFASSIFVLGLASQVYFASQGLVATKLLGLEAAAILAVTARASSIAMQSIWKPFDAFNPRWQVAICSGDAQRVTREFGVMARFTILIAVTAAVFIALVNQPFVFWWTKPEYFGGLGISLFLCGFMIIQGINRCFVAPFTLTLNMRTYTLVSIGSVFIAIFLMIVLTKMFGLIGIPIGLIVGDLLFPTWYYMWKGGQHISINGFELVRKDLPYWLPVIIVAILSSVMLEKIDFQTPFIWLILSGIGAIVISSPLLWRSFSLIKSLRTEPLSK